MSASAKHEPGAHIAFLNIGSNIDPARNIPRAVELLQLVDAGLALSTAYETRAVGSAGPNFINLAARLATRLDARQVKELVITSIENHLGRVRSADKNAPRTIDLDIILFDGQVLDENLWNRVHLAAPLAELLPDLPHPGSGESLSAVARRLLGSDLAIPRPDLLPASRA